MRFRLLIPGLVTIFLASLVGVQPILAQPAGKPKQLLSVKDLYLFDAPRTPVLSKDGKCLAYVRTWIDAASKTERHSLWKVEGHKDKKRPLEPGEPDAR